MMNNSHSIEYIELAAIKLRDRRWRNNPPRQIDEAVRQLDRVGQVGEPPLLDSENRVVCGGAIVQAARKLRWTHIPILRIANMSPDELRLYAINAHKLNDMGGYDEALLADDCERSRRQLRSPNPAICGKLGNSCRFGLVDPPYNIPSTISSNPNREEFAFAHGEMFARFLTTVMREMKAVSDEGSLHAFFMSYHYLLELLRRWFSVGPKM